MICDGTAYSIKEADSKDCIVRHFSQKDSPELKIILFMTLKDRGLKGKNMKSKKFDRRKFLQQAYASSCLIRLKAKEIPQEFKNEDLN